MEHYRVTIGLISPDINRMKDRPDYVDYRRKIQSAREFDRATRINSSQKYLQGLDLATEKKHRAPSAPLGLYWYS